MQLNGLSDYVVLLEHWFQVLEENFGRLRADKCHFGVQEMHYLGFDIGHGWWRPSANKLAPLLEYVINPALGKKAGVKQIRGFIGSANFHRRHVNWIHP